jgi:4-amino-4-deoxy-L-arabinose transferase-like glycosyltransferase
MNIDFIEIAKTIPFTLFILLIISVIVRLARLRKEERLIIYISFLIRACGAITLSYIGFDPWIHDTVKYDNFARLISQGYFSFNASLQVKCHAFIGGVIYYFFGHSIVAWAVLNAFIGALTVIVVIQIAKELFGTTEANISSILYAIFPSYVLFSALIQREVVVIFFITLSILYFIRYLKENRMKYLLIFVGFVIIGGLFRPLNAPLFLAISFPFILRQIYNSKVIQKSNIMKPFFLLLVFVVVPASIVGALFFSPLSDTILHKLTEQALLGEAEYRIAGQSVYLQNIKYTSIWSIFYYMPIKFIYFTFGPFIWMARNISTFLASL